MLSVCVCAILFCSPLATAVAAAVARWRCLSAPMFHNAAQRSHKDIELLHANMLRHLCSTCSTSSCYYYMGQKAFVCVYVFGAQLMLLRFIK